MAALEKRRLSSGGFERIFEALDDILKIVRKSDGKADAAQQIMEKYDRFRDTGDGADGARSSEARLFVQGEVVW